MFSTSLFSVMAVGTLMSLMLFLPQSVYELSPFLLTDCLITLRED